MSDIATAEDVEKVRARLRSGYFRQDEATEASYRAIELLLSRIDAMDGWISVEDKLPEYGDPVIISIRGTVQNVTYTRDAGEDSADWFEPYHFEHDDNTKCWCRNVSHWMPLPEPPA